MRQRRFFSVLSKAVALLAMLLAVRYEMLTE
jgi:hypothetical protein